MGIRDSRRINTVENFLTFRSDLHVHTVLSPCAEIEMIPPLIVTEAISKGINLIAITDHNASENILAVQKAAENTNLTVLPGMELQTKEEVHILCLFDTIEQIQTLQEIVNQRLPKLKNKPDFFGEQFIVDHTGDFIRRQDQLLITSANISITESYNLVNKLGGIIIPAHINRKANGLLENLGFVPNDIPVIALEISRHITPKMAVEKFPQITGYPLIQSGDVHRLDEFIGTTYLTIKSPSIEEIRMAIKGLEGRSLSISPNLPNL
ncbi:MAG: histidinol phosphatase [Anaerolineaceae bacterium]|nr:histidinol phosphatase [Anaerolineaceae bacterium]